MSESCEIAWTPTARRSLLRLPEKVAAAVVEFIYGPLAVNPHRVGKALRMQLAGLRSGRRGNYRVIHCVGDGIVTVTAIEHRADAYPS